MHVYRQEWAVYMARVLTLSRIRRLTGLPFEDGSCVVPRWSLEPILSVDDSEARIETPQHRDMNLTARRFLEQRGCPLTNTHIGFCGHDKIYQFADFAAEIGGRVVLVECLTSWMGSAEVISKKLQLDRHVTLWFVVQPVSKRSLAARGYQFIALDPIDPNAYSKSSKLLLAWKKIVAGKPDKNWARLRAAYARMKKDC
jgi:hypothetical protein